MSVAPLQQRALEDQLRRMQLQIDALERRMATGDAIQFDPLLTPSGSFPVLDTYAEYIRVNNMMQCNLSFEVSAAGSTGGSVYGWTIKSPYPFIFASGLWTLQRSSFGTLYVAGSGVVSAADASYGADRVQLQPTALGNDAYAVNLSDDYITFLDLSATAASPSGTPTTVNSSWTVGDRVEVMFTARIPAGS